MSQCRGLWVNQLEKRNTTILGKQILRGQRPPLELRGGGKTKPLTKALLLPVTVRAGMFHGHGEEGEVESAGVLSRENLACLSLPLGEPGRRLT